MSKTRFRGATFALAIVTVPSLVGCGATFKEVSAPSSASPTSPSGSASATEQGNGASLAQALEQAKRAEVDSEAVTEAGTDSMEGTKPPEVDSDIREILVRFAQQYLSFDYRLDPTERLETLSTLIDPAARQQLVTALPPALSETLRAEQRMVAVEVSSIAGLETLGHGAGVFRVSYATTTSSHSSESLAGSEASTSGDNSGPPTTKSETRTLVVVVGPEGLVEDVR